MLVPSLLALMLGGTLAASFLAFAAGEPLLAAELGGVAVCEYWGLSDG